VAIISIIVPVYQVEQFLHKCVDSILAQTFSDFELILVDDGSADLSPAICDAYEAQDNRIQVIHRLNGGLSAARNTGLDWILGNSSSEWVTFIDSDDWVHPMYLETLYRGAVSLSVDMSVCGFEHTAGDSPKVYRDKLDAVRIGSGELYVTHTVNAMIACGKLYKKELFRNVRYPIGRLHEDEFTTYRLLFSREAVAWIDQPLYAYFQNCSGITQSKWNPKRMDGMDAQREQIAFYEEKGLLSVREFAVRRYLSELCSHYYLSQNEYPNESKMLKKTLRKGLRAYKNIKGLSIRDDFRINYAAYPLETRTVVCLYEFTLRFLQKGG